MGVEPGRVRRPGTGPDLLVGEWACLAVLREGPTHGYAVSLRMAPSGDLGRIWTMSRPMVYQSLGHLTAAGYVEEVPGREPDRRGRTALRLTPRGRAAVDRWLGGAVLHLRDVRTELLLKLVVHDNLGRSPSALLRRQADVAEAAHRNLVASVEAAGDPDPVLAWRLEVADALRRTVQRLLDRAERSVAN